MLMRLCLLFTLSVVTLTAAGCTVRDEGGESTGTVAIDGSSTVYPITQAVAEEFQKVNPSVQVVVGTSGTGGGFKSFVRGETDINDASRPIKESEIEQCRESGISYLELKVALDGIAVVTNTENDWCESLTVEQLKSIWQPGSQVDKWSGVNPDWPDEQFKLYGPDTDSGTFDYFTEVICGESGASRADYTPSTDDNVLVRGVAGDRTSLGYFGFAYYIENRDKLKAIGIAPDSEKPAVKPTPETVESGEYAPLSRPLFLYVNVDSLSRPEVAEFLRFYLEQGQELITDVGYVRLSRSVVQQTRQALEEAISAATDRASDG